MNIEFKRYQNGKLFNTTSSCYATLNDVYQAVKEGNKVTVIDNKSKTDITSETLFHALVSKEKTLNKDLPLLEKIIQNENGTLSAFISK